MNILNHLISKKLVGLLGIISATALIMPVSAQPSPSPNTQRPDYQTPTPQSTPQDTLSPTSPGSTPKANSNLVNVAASNQSFSTLTKALKAAGLTQTLAAQGPYTVFAPTNQAFAALPKGTLEKLLRPENKQTLVRILSYHVLPGEVTSSDLKSGNVKTVEGSPVRVQVNTAATQVSVSNARVTQADIPASNGVIHVIDRVILPPNLKL